MCVTVGVKVYTRVLLINERDTVVLRHGGPRPEERGLSTKLVKKNGHPCFTALPDQSGRLCQPAKPCSGFVVVGSV